jgi:signal peptidase II
MSIIVISIIFFLDRLSKIIAVNNLTYGQSLPLIKGIFHLTLVYNRGAAFGILKNQLPFFILTTFLALGLVYFNLKSKKNRPPQRLYNLSLYLLAAGALGNLYDRFFFGHVIDFLDFRIWPVFNIADSAITIGAILLGWSVLRESKKSKG